MARKPRPFSLDWIRDIVPHFADAPFSDLHRELAADLADLRDRRGQRLDRLAPRGSAKSTVATKAFPLHAALEGYEPFILILSDSARQAHSFLRTIKREIESNPLIRAAYPNAAGVGDIWQTAHIRLRNGCEIMAVGAGGKIRGVSNVRRPSTVILDDVNDRKDLYSADRRGKKIEWLKMDVLPIGEPSTNFVCVGTPIHREAIPCVLQTDGWDTKSYRSIIDWPKRMDLWHKWGQLRTNIGDARRVATAQAFYEANRMDMDDGARVLWPERFPLADLMARRVEGGEAAFNCEYQDTPGTEGGTEWSPDYFAGPDFWCNALPDPAECVFRVQSLDPSKGRTDRPGDYQAHVCLAVTKDGTLWFDADGRREDVTEMVRRCNDLCDYWRPHTLVVEDNGTMGLLEAEFRDLDRAGKLKVPGYEIVTSTDPKAFRIRLVGPYLARRQVRVVNNAGGRLLVQQWQDWPNGDHDDLPDAASTALKRVLT